MAKTGPTATKTTMDEQGELFPTVEAVEGPKPDVIIDRYIEMAAIITNPNISADHKVSLMGVIVAG